MYGTPWATATKNVKKPPDKKGRTFIKIVIWTISDISDFLNVCPFSPDHPLESNMCKQYTKQKLLYLQSFLQTAKLWIHESNLVKRVKIFALNKV